MSLLQDSIVYIWFIPVVAQIIIPLAILIGWSVKRVMSAFFCKKSDSVAFAGSELNPVGSSA